METAQVRLLSAPLGSTEKRRGGVGWRGSGVELNKEYRGCSGREPKVSATWSD